METATTTKIVDILILFFNKVDQTISCINSFLPSKQDIYVLNNGSDAAQLAKLKRSFENHPQVHILDAGTNLGVSGGRNYLIQHTKAPWVLSVDNDITIQPEDQWLSIFQTYISQHPDAAIVAPLIYNVHEQAYSDQLQLRLEDKKLVVDTGSYDRTNCFPGGASIIRRHIFESYGLFDEDMFVGFEDYEYALRAIRSPQGAFTVHKVTDIQLIHDHQFQKKATDKKAVKQRYNEDRLTESYNRFVAKYGIEFEHEWQWWTRQQVERMTGNPWKKIKMAIKKMMSR